MTIIPEHYAPQRILSQIEASLITKREYDELKKASQREREEILKEYGNEHMNPNYTIKNRIRIRINDPKYADLPILKKEVIIANAILPDDTAIIDVLTENQFDNKFTYEHLKTIIRFRSILKNRMIYKTPITEELIEQIAIYKRVGTKLIQLFETNFGFGDTTVILNRICEMLETCPKHVFESTPEPKQNNPLR